MRLPFFYIELNNATSMKKKLLWLMATALLTASCYNEGTLVNNPAPLLQYQHKPTEARLLTLAKSYAEAINQNLKDHVIHPGQYADYGVALAKLGLQEQANVMFNNEKTFFPNSTKYVEFLKRTYTPNLFADNHFDTSKIDVKALDSIRVEYTPEELAAQQELEADPEYQKMLKLQQLEEKEAKAAAVKKAREERAKAKKAERKAQTKAREKEKREKEQVKKAAEKERAKAKKAEQKAKEEAKKAERKAKEEAKKAEIEAKKAAEKAEIEAKKAAEKAAAEAKQAEQKAQKEAEKAALKAQKEAEKAQKEAEREAEKAAKKAQKEASKASQESDVEAEDE